MVAASPLPEQVPERLPVGIRVGVADDVPLVMDSWLLSARESEGHVEGVRFTRWQKAMQRGVLTRPSTRLLVAHPDDDPSVIMGWIVYGASTPPVLHYVWTRYASRRLGIARMLLTSALPDSERAEVIYAARPAREFDEVSKRWVAPAIAQRIPRVWRFMPRAQVFEV